MFKITSLDRTYQNPTDTKPKYLFHKKVPSPNPESMSTTLEPKNKKNPISYIYFWRRRKSFRSAAYINKQLEVEPSPEPSHLQKNAFNIDPNSRQQELKLQRLFIKNNKIKIWKRKKGKVHWENPKHGTQSNFFLKFLLLVLEVWAWKIFRKNSRNLVRERRRGRVFSFFWVRGAWTESEEIGVCGMAIAVAGDEDLTY